MFFNEKKRKTPKKKLTLDQYIAQEKARVIELNKKVTREQSNLQKRIENLTKKSNSRIQKGIQKVTK